MVGVVLVGHGRLAVEVVRTLESVVGPLEAFEAVPTSTADGAAAIRAQIADAVRRVERGRGTLILTDMLGDTATNQALLLAENAAVEVVAGANVPMLIKVTTARREMDVHALAAFIIRYGREHIFWATAPAHRRRKAN